jgi:hypothetical protein
VSFVAGVLVGVVLALAAWIAGGLVSAPIPPWLLWRLRRPPLLKPGEAPTAAHYHHMAESMDLLWRDVRELQRRTGGQ